MSEIPLVHVRWSGDESIEITRKLILERHSTELDLPPNIHHALFAHLFPDAKAIQTEVVDSRGGADLVRSVATIGGFEGIGKLVGAIRQTNAKVHIQSPPPRILISHDGKG